MTLRFLDFEASSLDSGSYPIEIAWVGEDGSGECHLIRPHRSWRGWSPASQAIHNITREMLQGGRAAADVARRAHAALCTGMIVSDQPNFEQYWLDTLFKVAGLPSLPVKDYHVMLRREAYRAAPWIAPRAQSAAATAYETAKRTHRHLHRAQPDAQALWYGWTAVRDAVDAVIPASQTDGP